MLARKQRRPTQEQPVLGDDGIGSFLSWHEAHDDQTLHIGAVETAFDEWFRDLGFRGRDDLSTLAPGVRDQLRHLKAMFNDALANQKRGRDPHALPAVSF